MPASEFRVSVSDMRPRSSLLYTVAVSSLVLAALRCAAEDEVKNPAQLAAGHGYSSERHPVTTEDGYVLDVFRVWNASASPEAAPRRPVLVMPGVLCNAAAWTLTGPGKALAYILADQGYDVWLGSYRGNMFARKHVKLSPRSEAFWDFSYHEHGRYDLEAVLNQVVAATGEQRVRYVCHSMGCTMLLVLSSERPASRVSAAYMMAPGAYFGHSNASLFLAAPLMPTVQMGFYVLTSGEIPFNTWLVRKSLEILCGVSLTKPTCLFTAAFTTGGDSTQINQTESSSYMTYIPDSASTRDLTHYLQDLHRSNNTARYWHGSSQEEGCTRAVLRDCMATNVEEVLNTTTGRTFRQYNYGEELNLEKYGQKEPPSYDLSRVDMPVSIYYATEDILANPEDVLDLSRSLPRLARPPYLVPYAGFSHADFLIGMNARRVLYDQLVGDMLLDDQNLNHASASNIVSVHHLRSFSSKQIKQTTTK